MSAGVWLIKREVYDRSFTATPTRLILRSFSLTGNRLSLEAQTELFEYWDFASKKELSVLRGHTAAVTSVAFSPDGKQIISGSMDNTLRLWDVASGKELKRFEIKRN